MDKKILLLFSSLIILFHFVTGCTTNEEYKVDIQVDLEDAGMVSGEGLYDEGEIITIHAEPKEGYEFKGWFKDEEKISSEEKYEFEINEDSLFKASFKNTEKLSKEVGGWQVDQDVINMNDLEYLAVNENWQDDDESADLVSVGENFLASYSREKGKIELIAKDSLEVVDQIKGVNEGLREVDFLVKDYLLNKNMGDEKSYIYHVTHEGKEKVHKVNIFDSGLSLPDDENGRLSQVVSNVDHHINIDFGIVGDYIFIFPTIQVF